VLNLELRGKRMQLAPVEGQRIVAILSEALEKLNVLEAMAPEITGSSKDQSSQLVNDEISRIIEEQHILQARYEELIAHRSQLRNVSNKAKYKEIQTEIEEIATSLRYATKVLCRNLKENPNAVDNIRKVPLPSQFLSLKDTRRKRISQRFNCKY
jgi:hypothetical protein